MDQEAVLRLMRQSSSSIDDHATYADMVNSLALLLSESRGKFSKEVFDQLILLGAALYKAGLSQYRARDEVTSLMEKSVSDRKLKA